ncbi:N utilization substance protein B [Pullulanibacillus camelliae]|uniref:Transcription antitermination protein NusB n=1 Tax=Pullulanibacillus camelliae TaxID=1707096 RepID=A0A8J2YJC2_9BACL|nr:transcription antitermination factor NusB [Pullulanibacillus camelliae]GGE46537.1 N utilization substance protein B [Pullulanibacillus camelliae]
MNRRKAREKAIQALFQIDVGKHQLDEVLSTEEEEKALDPFFKQLVTTTLAHQEDIDATIKKYLIKWPFERLGNIDKAIMRLAVCEIKYFDAIPVKVSLNEAIELAKIFGDDDTRRFTNGVLSRLANQEQNDTSQGE